MSKRWGSLGNHSKRAAWLTLAAILMGSPPVTHAAEASGALTIIFKDQNTERSLSAVQITITERETDATQTVETDTQGRIVVNQLDPGLYAINLSKSGFTSLYEPSIRVITRKNSKIEFELGSVVLEEVVVQAQGADAFASPSSTYVDREVNRPGFSGDSGL